MVCDMFLSRLLTYSQCRLNPYSIGIWSATGLKRINRLGYYVLILILLEYGLRLNSIGLRAIVIPVLILILLEYGLRRFDLLVKDKKTGVLILILLEYGLRLHGVHLVAYNGVVLILILLEYGLRRI